MYKLIDFKNLSKEELYLVLKWRNHPNIRVWMYNKKKISMDEHLNFINSLKQNNTKEYFLLKKDDDYIGVIDLNGTYLGIYANPHKKRVGDILLNEIIRYAFDTKKLLFLKAEVYKENKKAIKLYERHGFKLKSQKNNLLTMELENENW